MSKAEQAKDENVYIASTGIGNFRTGQVAKIIRHELHSDNICLRVEFIDGAQDLWRVSMIGKRYVYCDAGGKAIDSK